MLSSGTCAVVTTEGEFEHVLRDYFATWIGAMDSLREPYPFAAACLACVILDHLGCARGATRPAAGQHEEFYCRYIRKYLIGFPDNQALRVRFYRTLRTGLVHEARTDDHRSTRQNAAPVQLTHQSFAPHDISPSETLIVSVPWLCSTVKAAWEQTRSMTDPQMRIRITERIKMYVERATLPSRPDGVASTMNTFESVPVSGAGSNFFTSPMDEIEVRAWDLTRPKRSDT